MTAICASGGIEAIRPVLTPGWEDFHRRWSGLKPPLRPHPDVVAAIGGAIGPGRDAILLLGATPELAGLGRRLTAVDWSASAIAHIWPGDDARRRIIRADWRALPLADGSIDAAIGDGSLAALGAWDDQRRALAELARVLRPGAIVAIRCYLTPDEGETLDDIRRDTLAGGSGGFHALKWRLAMAVAARGDPMVPVRTILAAFDDAFPDRATLTRATGWSAAMIAEIDAYAASPARFGFPTAGALLASIPPAFGKVRLVAAGEYPLAARCPILVMERGGG